MKRAGYILALIGAAFAVAPAFAGPARVVSMNLCTDQLAMMVAAPGQVISVSSLSMDPGRSVMANEAAGLISNHGLAEEIYLLNPDLVITGTFSNAATVGMLRRLDIPVAVFEPAYSLADVSDRLIEMGKALGREEAAAELQADYDARLAAIREELVHRPRAALYFANGYTSGEQTLAGEILTAAGFDNIAGEAGFPYGGFLPLEILALAGPDIVIGGRRYEGASRSEEILDHPVLKAMQQSRATGVVTDLDWVCGTPHVLRAIEGLAETRRALEDDE